MTAVEVIEPDWQVSPRIAALVTLRSGGISNAPYDSLNLAEHVGDDQRAVAENRRRVLESLAEPVQAQWLRQVHGTMVASIASAGPPLEADGIITKVPGVACCVLTADCLPIFLCDVEGQEVALVHAGWRGLAAGIIENALAGMQTPSERIRAWLGPAIGPCHFEVGFEVQQAFLSQDAALPESVFRSATSPGKSFADLYAIAHHKLQGAGVGHIGGGDRCTYCDVERLFSYRRDGVTGRLLSLIYLREESGSPHK